MHNIYRGNIYSPAVERSAIWNLVLDLCHSEERLRKEGYTLPATSTNGTHSASHPATRINPPCPDRNPSVPKCAALVIDCEMAGTANGENELVQVTILDFLTGRALLSRPVNPSRPILDWRENFTGLNAASMSDAVARNEALDGWEAAQAALWRFCDKETIIIGQSLQKDLQVLHTSHSRIIDSAIITADAVLGKKSKIKKRWGLEALCKELLGIQIRSPLGADGGGGAHHDALEDALAAREVVLFCARKRGQLETWARRTNVSFWRGNGDKRSTPRAGRVQSSKLPRQPAVVRRDETEDDYEDEDEEPLRWEDVVDWDTWPKSPPDSD
ncbi:exonuclease [Colletotrichum orchidophilum]|uniref:Exonuclease n=1 Tax=Colletotrichum orchidophilum TaxID=1209926 RepID=A0A1G4B0H6_9PEZI|nr:exonuclease [Colletotrichum orchidophilum]OHE94881.1 exonuclease [Colletotrichum orchidophilum]